MQYAIELYFDKEIEHSLYELAKKVADEKISTKFLKVITPKNPLTLCGCKAKSAVWDTFFTEGTPNGTFLSYGIDRLARSGVGFSRHFFMSDYLFPTTERLKLLRILS